MHQFIMNIASHRCPSFGSLPDLKTAQGMFNKFQDKFKKKNYFLTALYYLTDFYQIFKINRERIRWFGFLNPIA